MLRNFKVLFVLFTIMIVSVAAYAFAAANTVPATNAGAGSGVVSGYTISSIVYNLNATDPSNLDSVNFTLSAAAVNVKIKLVAAGSTWYNCTVVTVNNFTCATAGATVSSMDQLNVVASSN